MAFFWKTKILKYAKQAYIITGIDFMKCAENYLHTYLKTQQNIY